MVRSSCISIRYVKEVGGTDTLSTTQGSYGSPWRTVTYGEKYGLNLIVRPGYYTTGETFPINIYFGQAIRGETPDSVTIEAPSSYAGNVFELGFNGTLESCQVRNLSTTTGKALARVLKGYGEIRKNKFYWGRLTDQRAMGFDGSSSGLAYRNVDWNIGYGINLNTTGAVTVDGNTFVKQTTAGVYSALAGTYIIKNNIISSSPEGAAVAGAYGIWRANGTQTNTYNDVYLNTTNYSGTVFGAGSTTIEAKFVNKAINDYHLLSSSPCINAGDPASPKKQDGTNVDMGAFAYYGTAAYKTMVGSAAAWSWAFPTATSLVPAGTNAPKDWGWMLWVPDSGLLVPKGSSESWSWGAE